jgi:hypothetical protein
MAERPKEAAWEFKDTDHIGDPTRLSWTSFLSRAFELGYLTPEEYARRLEIIAGAVTKSDIEEATRNLPCRREWGISWNEARKKGLQPRWEITPQASRRRHRDCVRLFVIIAIITAIIEMTVFIGLIVNILV